MAILTDENNVILLDELGNVLTDEFGVFAEVVLTLVQTTGGTIAVNADGPSYAEGAPLILTATPTGGYALLFWSLNGQRFHNNPLAINIYQDLVVSAYFVLIVPVVPTPTGSARCPFCRGGDRCPVCGGSGWVR